MLAWVIQQQCEENAAGRVRQERSLHSASHRCDACAFVTVAGAFGWYTVFNTTSTSSFTAPKRLELALLQVPRNKWVYWASCWPAGKCSLDLPQ